MAEMIKSGRREIVNTSGYLMSDGWVKIGESGGAYRLAHLWNPRTDETASVCIYDYDDPRKEDDFWHDISIDADANREYCRRHGIIIDGLRARVVKGRKVPVGFTGLVVKIRKVYDRYDRWVANYVVFEDGTSTNVDNCVLAEEV